MKDIIGNDMEGLTLALGRGGPTRQLMKPSRSNASRRTMQVRLLVEHCSR